MFVQSTVNRAAETLGGNLTKEERIEKPTYVSPSVDSRGLVRKGYVRMPVSTNKKAIRKQGKSRYYYETKGKYRRKRCLDIFTFV